MPRWLLQTKKTISKATLPLTSRVEPATFSCSTKALSVEHDEDREHSNQIADVDSKRFAYQSVVGNLALIFSSGGLGG
jgi:hypothetical protein